MSALTIGFAAVALLVLMAAAYIYYGCRKHPRRSSSGKGSKNRRNEVNNNGRTNRDFQEVESPNILVFPYVPEPRPRSPSDSSNQNTSKNNPYSQQRKVTQSNPNINTTARPVQAHNNQSSLSHESLLMHTHKTKDPMVVIVDRPSRSKTSPAFELKPMPAVYLTPSGSVTRTARPLQSSPDAAPSPLPRPLNRLNGMVIVGSSITPRSKVVADTIKKPVQSDSSSDEDQDQEREQRYPPVTFVPKSPNMAAIISTAKTVNKNHINNGGSSSSSNGNQTTSPPLTPQKNARRLSMNAKQNQRQPQPQPQQAQLQPHQQQRSPFNQGRVGGAIEEGEEDLDGRVSTENPFLGKEELYRNSPQAILPEGYKQETHSIPIPTLPHKNKDPVKPHQDSQRANDPRYDPQQQRSRVDNSAANHEQAKKVSAEPPRLGPQPNNNPDVNRHEEMESAELVTTASLVLEPYLRATTPPPPLPVLALPTQPHPRAPSPIQPAAIQAEVPLGMPPRRVRSISRSGSNQPQQLRPLTPLSTPSPTFLSPAQDSPIDPPTPSSSELDNSSLHYSSESSTTWVGLIETPHSLPPLKFSPLSSLSEIKPPSPRTIAKASELSPTPGTTTTATTTTPPPPPPPLPRTQSKTPPPLPPPRGSRANSPYDSSNSISTSGNISVSISNTNTNSSRLNSALVSAPLSIQSRPNTPQPLNADSSSPTSVMSQTSPTSAKVASPKTPGSASSTNDSPWVAMGSDRYHDDREETRRGGGGGGRQPKQVQESWELGSETIWIQSSIASASSPGSSPAKKKTNHPQAPEGTGTRLSTFNFRNE